MGLAPVLITGTDEFVAPPRPYNTLAGVGVGPYIILR